MPTYQYRREQRVTIEADNEDAAWKAAEELQLTSRDDESDDKGEMELLEGEELRDWGCCGCTCSVCMNGHSGGAHAENCEKRMAARQAAG